MAQILTSQPFTLKIILVLLFGIILLRLAGKRSIALLSVPEVVLMIAVGTLLVQPTNTTNEWLAIYGGFLLTGGMLFVSYLQIKFPRLRKWINGVPSILIQHGEIDLKELKKSKLNIDQLEMRLRQLQVANVADVETAVLETSGELTVLLKTEKQAASKEDIQQVLDQLQSIRYELAELKKLKLLPVRSVSAVPDVTEEEPSPLFREAVLEDAVDNNISTQ